MSDEAAGLARDAEDVEELAKAAFEHMVLRYGVSPFHVHTWHSQTDDLKDDWRSVVRMIRRGRRAGALPTAGERVEPNDLFTHFRFFLTAT